MTAAVSKFDSDKTRKPNAQLGLFLIIAVIVVGVGVGAFAMDISHMMAVRKELHNATDAGALAGASDLWLDPGNAASDALAVTARNTADGRAVALTSPGTTVAVKVTAPTATTPGEVEVSATMAVRHLFAPFADRFTDTIAVSSVAGTAGKLTVLDQGQAFPLAVSIDTTPSDKSFSGKPLNQYNLGETINLYIGSQKVKNAAFTSLKRDPSDANYIRDLISAALGVSEPEPGFVPSVQIGDDINLNNGVVGEKALAKPPLYDALLHQPTLVLPVVQGDPPYNQSRKVVGFIGLKVTGVTINQKGGIVETITGTLCSPQVTGGSGSIPGTGNSANDSALNRLEPGPIQLIR